MEARVASYDDNALRVVSISGTCTWVSRMTFPLTILMGLDILSDQQNRPVIGGFVVVGKGWRWTQWTILLFTIAAYIMALGMKETYKKTILQRHAKKMGTETPSGPSGLAALKFLLNVTFFRPLHMLVTEPIVIAWSLYIGFSFAVLYSFFAAFPLVYATVYGFDIQQVGLTFISIAIGSLLGSLTIILVDRYTYQPLHVRSKSAGGSGSVLPEHRLYAAMIGSFGLPIGLFWFAWTATKSVHWISSVAAAVPFAWGNFCVFVSNVSIRHQISSLT